MKKKLTRKEAIEYQCWECLGFYIDGRIDCENVRCPLYAYMPYRRLQPAFSYENLNPKRKGKVTWEESRQEKTEKQLEALKKYRESKNNEQKDTE